MNKFRVIGALLVFVFSAHLYSGPPCSLPSVEVSNPVPLAANADADTPTNDDVVCIRTAGSTTLAVWVVRGGFGLDGDLYVSRSTDSGQTWSVQTLLNSNAMTDGATDEAPQVAGDGLGNWIAVWYSEDTLDGTVGNDRDIFFSRSVDDGITWSNVAALNSNATTDSGSDLAPRIAVSGQGTWITVWRSNDPLSGVGTDYDIFYSLSVDNGNSWSSPAALYEDAANDGTVFDHSATVAADSNNGLIVVWVSPNTLGDTIEEDQDLLFRRSTDGGANWSTTAALNSDATNDTDTGDETPHIATDGNGNWVVVWGRILPGEDLDIYGAGSVDGGVTWSTPGIVNQNGLDDIENDLGAQVACNGAGAWVATWHSIDLYQGAFYQDPDVFVAVSTDAGTSWSRDIVGNTTAALDVDFDDVKPSVTAAPNGDFLLAWISENTLNASIGFDDDVLIATIHLSVAQDCDSSESGDPCEILLGDVEDANYNGLPDECDPAAPSPIMLHKIALDGETAPNGNAFTEFRAPVSTATSEVIYRFVAGTNAIGLWTEDDHVVLRETEDSAPGTSVSFSGFSGGMVHPQGKHVFEATLFGEGVSLSNDKGFWFWESDTTSLVAREGDLAAGAGGAVFQNIASSGIVAPRVNDDGEVVFTATLTGTGVTPSNDVGLWHWDNETQSLLAREGDTAPGTAIPFLSLERPRIDSSGNVAFMGKLNGAGFADGIWFGPPSSFQLLALEGAQAPGMSTGVNFSSISSNMFLMNDTGQIAFHATLSGSGISNSNNDSIWRYDSGVLSLVLQEGAIAPDLPTGTTFSNLALLAIAPNGRLVLGASFIGPEIDGGNSGLFVESSIGWRLIAREDDPAPGSSAGSAFKGFTNLTEISVAVNAHDEIVFHQAVDGLMNATGVWAWTPNRGVLTVVAGVGAPFVADGQAYGDFAYGGDITPIDASVTGGMSNTLNDDGVFVLRASYKMLTKMGIETHNGIFLAMLPSLSDLNSDFTVDGADHAAFCAAMNTVNGDRNYSTIADLNGDGAIDELDLALFLEDALVTCLGDVVSSDTFQPPSDGIVDAADLAYLLGAWGDAPSCADLVTSKTFQPPPDGAVDAADLAFMLGAWGVCD